jgi:hypothetical protein
MPWSWKHAAAARIQPVWGLTSCHLSNAQLGLLGGLGLLGLGCSSSCGGVAGCSRLVIPTVILLLLWCSLDLEVGKTALVGLLCLPSSCFLCCKAAVESSKDRVHSYTQAVPGCLLRLLLVTTLLFLFCL